MNKAERSGVTKWSGIQAIGVEWAELGAGETGLWDGSGSGNVAGTRWRWMKTGKRSDREGGDEGLGTAGSEGGRQVSGERGGGSVVGGADKGS